MLDFITRTFSGIIGLITGSWQSAINAVTNGIRDLFRTHYIYWHTVTGHVGAAWQALTRDILIFEQSLQQFLFAQGLFDSFIIKREIPWLAGWISWLGGKIRNDLNNLFNRVEHDIKAGDAAQHAYTRSVLFWVIVHVLAFLYNLVKSIFGWINGIGSTMWHYFTHLAEFAELLIMWLVASLEKHAWEIGKLLGTFFLSLVVHNLAKFSKLLEDIVDAVL